MILCITCYSCDDPYKDTVFKVYDVQPAATYLQSRPDDFSEWVKVLKYGDLFNAVNRAEDAFTVLAPTNDAVLRFYEKKGVTSIEDLGYEYLTASCKVSFSKNVERFLIPEITDKPMIFEVFTEQVDENEALYTIRNLEKSTDKIMESIAKKLIVNVAGEEGFEKVKKIIRGR